MVKYFTTERAHFGSGGEKRCGWASEKTETDALQNLTFPLFF